MNFWRFFFYFWFINDYVYSGLRALCEVSTFIAFIVDC